MFYVVRALSPYTEYEFYVIAVNNIGRGPPSIPATTTTGETGNKYSQLIVWWPPYPPVADTNGTEGGCSLDM